jgi:glycerol kinase
MSDKRRNIVETKQGKLLHLGIAISTTEFAIGGITDRGKEVYASVPMRGMHAWLDQPACDLEHLFPMMRSAMRILLDAGWEIAAHGAISVACRQHDMVLVDSEGNRLGSALTWQCKVAEKQVIALRQMGVEDQVGQNEPRFIMPKLVWFLENIPHWRSLINRVMTTGDYLAWRLTGCARLATSDALSNGLLNQRDKSLAHDALELAGLNPEWFPEVVISGQPVGEVINAESGDPDLDWCRNILSGWTFYAGLGDNHAAGMGIGLRGVNELGVSAGSSGTLIRLCPPHVLTFGRALQFDYWGEDRLLLMMLADCGVWYKRFCRRYAKGCDFVSLNQMAESSCYLQLKRIRQAIDGDTCKELYPDNWDAMSLPERVASTQLSIALEMALLAKLMLEEISGQDALTIQKLILTGGLSRSDFFAGAFSMCLNQLGVVLPVFTLLPGPMTYKPDAKGAMMNAMLGAGVYPSLEAAAQDLCSRTNAAAPLTASYFPDDFFKAQ